MNALQQAFELKSRVNKALTAINRFDFDCFDEPEVLFRAETIAGILIIAGQDITAMIEAWSDSMAPNHAALAAHEHQIADSESRDAAGLPGGNPMPFTPTITTLDHRAHGCEEGCDCPACRDIQETLARSDPLRQVETY